MSESPSVEREAFEELAHLVDTGDAERVAGFVHLLPPEDTAYTIHHLDEEHRSRFFALLAEADADLAADLFEHFDDAHAADMVAELEPETAATIVEEMDSDEQADVLGELEDHEAEAILEEMAPEAAEDLRTRLTYDEDTAGGLMINEFLAYPQRDTVEMVIDDLREHHDEYKEYEVRYLYAVDEQERLAGVVPMRRIVMSPRGTPLAQLGFCDPVTVEVGTHLDDLEDLFDRVDYSAVPVLEADGRLVGVVQRAAVQEARSEAAEEDLAKVGGIVGGEELRSMPVLSRAARRLMFLLPIMVLLMGSASVIRLFVETVEKVPVLAAFLPVVAGLCGSSGGQAVAVSMREISLGLINAADLTRVLIQEAAVSLVIGLLLGVVMFGVTWLWDGNLYMGLVIGGSIVPVLLVATCIGGAVPVALRGLGIDPAMASGPVVTTVVDLVGFFVVLAAATLFMHRLVS